MLPLVGVVLKHLNMLILYKTVFGGNTKISLLPSPKSVKKQLGSRTEPQSLRLSANRTRAYLGGRLIRRHTSAARRFNSEWPRRYRVLSGVNSLLAAHSIFRNATQQVHREQTPANYIVPGVRARLGVRIRHRHREEKSHLMRSLSKEVWWWFLQET